MEQNLENNLLVKVEKEPEEIEEDFSDISQEDSLWYRKSLKMDSSGVVERKLFIVMLLCTFFIIVEFIGAYIAKSTAVKTDAIHLLSDLIGFFFSWFSVYLGKKKSTSEYSFGFVRSEIVGALLSIFIIWGMALYILQEATIKIIMIYNGTAPQLHPVPMLITSIIGLIVNIVMAFTLHSSGHGHGIGHGGCSHGHNHDDHKHGHNHDNHKHGHNHDDHKHGHNHDNHKHGHNHDNHKHDHSHDKHNHSHDNHNHSDDDPKHDHSHDDNNNSHNEHKHFLDEQKPQQISNQFHQNHKGNLNLSMVNPNDNQNVKAALAHIIGDLVQSVGVVIAAIIIICIPSWVIVDPLLSIMFIIITVYVTIPVTIDIVQLLMDSTPKNLDIQKFKEKLEKIQYVEEIHDLHVWNMNFGKPNMTCHIICSQQVEKVLKKATLTARKVGIYHSTIQVEVVSSVHSIDCNHNLHNQYINLNE